jgi:hypothetical protein
MTARRRCHVGTSVKQTNRNGRGTRVVCVVYQETGRESRQVMCSEPRGAVARSIPGAGCQPAEALCG